MPKKALKALAPLLIKHTGDSDPEVREASYAALGSAMRTIGEKPILPLISDIVSDALKMTKVRLVHIILFAVQYSRICVLLLF